MTKLFFIYFILLSMTTIASAEILKGVSSFSGSSGDKSCEVTIIRDEETKEITGLRVRSSARVVSPKGEASAGSALITEKSFAEYRFYKQIDLSGEGFMLTGEKSAKSQNENHRVYIHFNLKEGRIIALQMIEKIKNQSLRTLSSYEQSCTDLKN